MPDPKLNLTSDDLNYALDTHIQRSTFQPSVIDEKTFKKFNGNRFSSLDPTDLQDAYANTQSGFGLLTKGVGRTLNSALFEILKTPGYISEAADFIATGDDHWDNAYLKGLNDAKEYVNENALPVYMRSDVQNGSVLSKLQSGAWWATTGADGAGFMLSMMVPGQALKLLKVGSYLSKGISAVDGLIAEGNVLSRGAKLIKPFTKGLTNTATASKMDGYIAAGFNGLVESAAEANNTYTDLRNKFISQGYSEEEAGNLAGDAASNVFKANIPVLFASNLIMERYLMNNKIFGETNKKATSRITKDVLEGVAEPKLSKFDSVWKYPGKIVGGFGREGFFEEGFQTTLQNYYSDKALKGEKTDAVSDLGNILSNWWDNLTGQSETSGEFYEAAILGGILNAPFAAKSAHAENKDIKETLFGREAYNPGTVAKLSAICFLLFSKPDVAFPINACDLILTGSPFLTLSCTVLTVTFFNVNIFCVGEEE